MLHQLSRRLQHSSKNTKILLIGALLTLTYCTYYTIDALNLLNNLHYTAYSDAALSVKAVLDAAAIPFFLTQSSALLAHRERTFKKYKVCFNAQRATAHKCTLALLHSRDLMRVWYGMAGCCGRRHQCHNWP
jgi:hypothetical protein